VDVILMEVAKSNTRDLGASLVSAGTNGLSVPATFTGGTATSATATSGAVRLSQLGNLSTNDFSIALPGAQLKALMTSSDTKILQSPQVRALDGMKASLKIGDRVPYSTGGIQTATAAGTAGGVFNSFQYLDVGVNVDITPKVHGTDEVTLHIELTISSLKDRIDIGGISQPETSNRSVIHDIRLKEGEVSLLGGLVQSQETKSVSGLPVLSSIPILGRLFSTESVTRSNSELLIAIVPHVVRGPDLDELSFKGIASGNERTVHMSYAPQATGEPAPAAAPQAPAAQPIQPAPLPVPGVPQAAAPAAGTPRILFSPSPAEVQAGGTLTLSIQAANVTDLFSAPLRIKFDQNVLRLDEVNRGGFLAGDGREILFTRNIRNDTGEASVNLSRMPGSGGLSGSGTLLTFTFQVIGKGVTTISVPALTLQDSRGQAIRAPSPQVAITVR
jgi:general secretion pathway protein D